MHRNCRLLLLLTWCALTATACSDRTPSDADVPQEESKLPDQIITGFDITITDMGVKKTEVQAALAYVFENDKRIDAKDLNVKFYSSSGQYFSELWADSGTIDMETNNMHAIGNVVVLTEDSLKLETESLDWDEKEQEITSDDSVVFYQKKRTVRGKGLVSDPGLKDVVILEPTGRFEQRKKETGDR
jgi:LPS export ABC transporter protein LptC